MFAQNVQQLLIFYSVATCLSTLSSSTDNSWMIYSLTKGETREHVRMRFVLFSSKNKNEMNGLGALFFHSTDGSPLTIREGMAN
jgi:hypothetical protein